jgi:hypothetical protein
MEETKGEFMGEFTLYHFGVMIFMFLPFIVWGIKPPKLGIMSIMGHFFKWYSIGFLGLMASLFITLAFDHPSSDTPIEMKSISQPHPVKIPTHIKSGVTLI